MCHERQRQHPPVSGTERGGQWRWGWGLLTSCDGIHAAAAASSSSSSSIIIITKTTTTTEWELLDTLDDHFDLVDHDRAVYQQYHQYNHNHHHHDNTGNAGPSETLASSRVGVVVGQLAAAFASHSQSGMLGGSDNKTARRLSLSSQVPCQQWQ